MVELMVAMAVSLFLLAGLFTIMQGTRRTSDNERLLAQFQDNQRAAMALISPVIESAAYYSNAFTVDAGTALPVSTVHEPFNTQTQGVYGVKNFNAQGDSLTLRYQANQVDGVMSCQGAVQPDGLYENQLSVNNLGQLVCSINGGNPIPLVGSVQMPVTSLKVLYGVGSSLTTPNSTGTVDAYLDAAQMNANPIYWTNVYTVRVSLTFANPLANQPGQANQPTVTFVKVISLKSRTGVNVQTVCTNC
jgi:type IV pilus assembly protein PilW